MDKQIVVAPDTALEKTRFLPLTCFGGHQIYAVYFPALDRPGFGCGICHKLGTTMTHGKNVLEIARVTDSLAWTADKRADLLLGMDAKAAHVTCNKKHFILGVEFPDLGQYGFGCIHCKTFSMTIRDRGHDLEIRVVREVKAEAAPPRLITNDPSFSKVIH